jgi:AraC-like DNA-binding protein
MVLVIISVFVSLMLVVFFLITPRGSINENRTLAGLLLVFGLQILYSYMTSNYGFRYFMEWHKPIFLIRQTALLTGPLVYFYVIAFIRKNEVFTSRSLLHFLPFAFSVVCLSAWYRTQPEFIIWQSRVALPDTILILASNFIYILLAAGCMRKAGISFRSLFRSLSVSPHITWLQVLVMGYIVLWIVNLNSFTIYMILRRPSWCSYTASIYALTFFLFINILMFLLLMKPDIYYILTKYRNNRLEEQQKENFLNHLNAFMTEHKPYLNPDITLESLAGEIGMNPRTLSQIINTAYGKSFKHYILDHRIHESMKILADKKTRNLTILEVLYQVGFNSKSTFNNQFKLYTNLTPQEYRAKCRA